MATRDHALRTVRVECHAGYRGEETPRRFFLDDRRIEVLDVLDRWLAPDHRYFKVRGRDCATYILRHDMIVDCWEVSASDPPGRPRRAAPPTRPAPRE